MALNEFEYLEKATIADPQVEIEKPPVVEEPVEITQSSEPGPTVEEMIAEEVVNEKKQRLELSMRMAVDKDPDRQAKVARLAQQTKMPMALVENNFDELSKIFRHSNFDTNKVFEDSPVSAQFLSDPTNASLAQDDIKFLTDAEFKLAEQKTFASNALDNLWEGSKDLGRNALTTLAALNKDNRKYFDEQLAKGNIPVGIHNALAGNFQEQTYNFLINMRDSVELTPLEVERAEGFEQYLYDFTRMVPQLAGAIGSTVAAGPAAGAAFIGSHIFGGTYSELTEKGVEHDDAMKAASSNAVVQSALEMLPLSIWAKSLKMSGAKNVAKNFMALAVAEFGTEFLQGFPDEYTRIWGEAQVEGGSNEEVFEKFWGRLPEIAKQGAYEGLVVLPAVFFGGAMKLPYELKQQRKLDTEVRINSELSKEVAESKLRERAPEKVKEHISSVIQHYGVEPRFYVEMDKIDALFQKDEAGKQKFIEDMGIEEEIAEARELGTDVSLDKAQFLTKYAGSDVEAGLTDFLRFEPSGVTLAEMVEKKKDAVRRLQELDKDEKTDLAKDYFEQKKANELPSQVKDLREFLVAPKEQGGQSYSAKDADSVALSHFAFLRVQADKLGVTVDKFMADNPLFFSSFQNYQSFKNNFTVDNDGFAPGGEAAQLQVQRNEDGHIVFEADSLQLIEDQIRQGEAGSRSAKVDENGDAVGTVAKSSTFPSYFKDKGYKKKDILNILKKIKDGKKLTDKQRAKIEDLYEGMIDSVNNGVLYQGLRDYQNHDMQVVKSDEETVIRAYDGDVEIGHVSMSLDSNDENFLFDVYENELSDEVNETLQDFEVVVTIRTIEVNEDRRGQGIGKSLMAKALEEITRNYPGVPININASPMGTIEKESALPDLIQFYKDFGFTELANYGDNALMMRDPNPNNTLFQTDTESDNFKAWFGDSKVVDENGKPLVVYHGTDSDIEIFDREKTTTGPSRVGFWFADDKSFAEMFGSKQIPVYVSIQNPKILTQEDWDDMRVENPQDTEWFENFRAELIEQGHDGVLVEGSKDKVGRFEVNNPTIIAAFENTQIKSATNNNGQYSQSNPNILFQQDQAKPQPNDLGFYSKLQYEIEKMSFKSMPAKDLIGRIQNINGIKQDEIEATGLTDWLQLQDGKIKKEDLEAFIKANGVQIKEVVLGDPDLIKKRQQEETEALRSTLIKDNENRLKDYREELEKVDASISEAQSIIDSGESRLDVLSEKLSDYDREISESSDNPVERLFNAKVLDPGGENAPLIAERDQLIDDLSDAQIELPKLVRERNDLLANIEHAQERLDDPDIALDEWADLHDDGRSTFDAPAGETKYSQYTLEGGVNYREVLLTLPEIADREVVGYRVIARNRKNNGMAGTIRGADNFKTKEEAQDYIDNALNKDVFYEPEIKELGRSTARYKYRSSHWDEENVLAHLRLKDYIDKDGKRVLLIEEIQSDWHQAGKKRGYKNSNGDLDKTLDSLSKKYGEIKAELAEIGKISAFEAATFRELQELDIKAMPQAAEKKQTIFGLAKVRESGKFELFEMPQDDGSILYRFAGPTIEDGRLTGRQVWMDSKDLDEIVREVDAAKAEIAPKIEEHGRLEDEMAEVEKQYKARSEEVKSNIKIVDYHRTGGANPLAVPDAPFKNTDAWAMLVFKRAMKMAVDGGYDSIGITPGDIQAERYDLSTKISAVTYTKQGTFVAVDLSGNPIITDSISEDKIEDHIGKELAEKLLATEPNDSGDRIVKGDDIKVSHKGMIGFYDKILPKAIKKYTKQKLEVAEIVTGTKELSFIESKKASAQQLLQGISLDEFKKDEALSDKERSIYFYEKGTKQYRMTIRHYDEDSVSIIASDKADDRFSAATKFKNMQSLKEALSEKIESIAHQQVWSIPITDEIKAKVEQGQTLFQGQTNPRGAYIPQPGGNVIALFENANKSTILHELSHYYFKTLEGYAETSGNEGVYKDWRVLADTYGTDREGHEAMARAFERYLTEGKAPSLALADAFHNFKKWLVSIYKSLTGPGGAELSDEVRGIFDRMLATESEIKEAQEYYEQKNDLISLIAGDDELAKKRLEKGKAKAQRTAEEIRLSKHLKAYMKAIGGKKAIQKDATETVEKEPIYIAMQALIDDGGLSTEEITDDYGEVSVKNLKGKHSKLIKKGGGANLVDIAIENGFDSPEALVQELLKAEKKKEAIKQLTEQMVAEKEAGLKKLLDDGAMLPGDYEIHNDERLAYLLAQEQILVERINREQNGANKKRTEMKAVKDAAREVLRRKRMKDAAAYYRYAKTEQTQANKAYKYLKEGNLEKAHEAIQKQVLNHVMVQEAVKARDFKQKVERYYKAKAIKGKMNSVEFSFSEVALDLIQHFGLASTKTVAPTKPDQLPSISDLDETLAGMTPQWILERRLPHAEASWRDLSLEQVEELHETIRAVMALGRDELRSLDDLDMKTIAEFVSKHIAKMEALPDYKPTDEFSKLRGAKSWIEKTTNELTMNQFRMEELDNYTYIETGEFGPGRKLFNWGASREGVYNDTKNKVNKDILEPMRILSQARDRIREDYGSKAFEIEGVPVPDLFVPEGRNRWTAERLVAILMNLGNEGNVAALDNSYGLSVEQKAIIVEHFTKEELQAVQSIWEAIDQLFPELDAEHFKIYNRHMTKVKPKPITLQAKDGEITLAGGYYPLVFDHALSDRADEFQQEDMLKNQTNAVLRKTKPEDGFKNQRVQGHSLPPKLDMSVLTSHIDQTARYISHAAYLRDLNRITNDPAWSAMVKKKLGKTAYKSIRAWVEKQAAPSSRTIKRSLYERFFEKQRALATVAILGANVSVSLKQRLSLFSAAHEIGWKWIAVGMHETGLAGATLGQGTNEKWKNIMEQSAYMRARDGHIDKEINDQVKKWNPLIKVFLKGKKAFGKDIEFTLQDVKDAMFVLISMNDRATVMPVWYGAYNKHMHLNADKQMSDEGRHKAAIGFADSAVRDTQPSSLSIDLAEAQYYEGLMRYLTPFMTWTMKYQNRVRIHFKAYKAGKMSRREYLSHLVNETVLSSWGNILIGTALLTGDLPEEEEFLFAPLTTLVSGVPVVRDVPNAIRFVWGDVGGTTATEGVRRHANSLKSLKEFLADDKEFSKVMWDVSRSVEFQLGIPATKVYKNMKRTHENMTED